MPRRFVMVMRHAEKPSGDGRIVGVDEAGREDPNELSVRGWQRAGALVPWLTWSARLPKPVHLFAPRATALAQSRRSASTLAPLAAALGTRVNTDYAKDDVIALAATIRALEGPVLVAWQHEMLIHFVNNLVEGDVRVPARWPADRFDLLWTFEQEDDDRRWRFTQVPQLLLAGDSDEPAA